MENQVCTACQEPLLVEVDSDSDDDVQQLSGKGAASTQSVLDDVELPCGCHFHWECFLDSSTITQCSTCDKNISSLSAEGEQQVLVTVRNEGGTQHGFDILPSATEEAYLRTYPEERRGHALLEFVREGDLDAVVHLLRENDQDEDDTGLDVLRYCGTFEGIEGSALHVAIRYGREEIAWLLLALGSSLGWDQFPPGAVEALNGVGLGKEDRKPTPDVRTLKDGEGRLPVDVAGLVAGSWTPWIESGKLNA